MADKDPLEGFRDLTPEQLESRLRERLGDHNFLVDLWQMGEQMAAYVETPAGALLVKTFTDEFNEAVLALLGEARPDTDGARHHFFEARTRWLLLQLIKETVSTGKASERLIIADDARVTP